MPCASCLICLGVPEALQGAPLAVMILSPSNSPKDVFRPSNSPKDVFRRSKLRVPERVSAFLNGSGLSHRFSADQSHPRLLSNSHDAGGSPHTHAAAEGVDGERVRPKMPLEDSKLPPKSTCRVSNLASSIIADVC